MKIIEHGGFNIAFNGLVKGKSKGKPENNSFYLLLSSKVHHHPVLGQVSGGTS